MNAETYVMEGICVLQQASIECVSALTHPTNCYLDRRSVIIGSSVVCSVSQSAPRRGFLHLQRIHPVEHMPMGLTSGKLSVNVPNTHTLIKGHSPRLIDGSPYW